jgi:hypothetical protein
MPEAEKIRMPEAERYVPKAEKAKELDSRCQRQKPKRLTQNAEGRKDPSLKI